MSDIPAELSERFEVHALFSKGRTGTTHHATERSTGRRGLLKVLDADVLGSTSERQRIKRELTKQGTISHPTLALPWASGEAGKTLWFFRAHVEARTLAKRLEEDGPLTSSEAFILVAQLAEGLDELHRGGLLFRDLQPAHVALRDDSSVIAFGAGVAPSIPHDELFDLSGTPEYVSPEQTAGKLVSFRSDLYSLGCLFHAALTGRPPFTGDVAEVLGAHAETEPTIPEGIPEEAAQLLGQLLAKDPKQRPFSAQQVRRALDPLLPDLLKSGEQPLERVGKATLLGMPAVPQPPSMAPPRPPSMEPPKPPAAEASKRNPDATQQVSLDQIEMEASVQRSAPPPPPSGRPSAPPPPPGARTSAPAAPPPSGRPSAPAPSAPPPPPSMRSSAPAEAEGARGPATAPSGDGAIEKPKPTTADATQQLSPVDIEEVEAPSLAATALPSAAVLAASPSPSSGPEASPLGAATPSLDASGQPEEVGDDEVAAMAGPIDDLDYDDLAETMAREAPSSLAEMQPRVNADPMPQAAYAPDRRDPTPILNEERVSHTPTMFSPEPANRNGLYMLGAGALVFLSAVLIVGYFAFFQQPAAAPIAAVTPGTLPAAAAPATSAEVAPEPAVAPQPAVAPTPAPEPAVTPTPEPEPAVEPEPEPAVEPEPEPEPEVAPEAEPEVASRMTSRATRPARERPARERPARGASPFDQAREAALAAFRARDYAAAEQAYTRATAINGSHAGSWAGLGAARMSQRNFNGAVQAYQRAVQLQPSNAGFFASLGHAFRGAGNTAAARQSYQRALAISPGHASAQQALSSL